MAERENSPALKVTTPSHREIVVLADTGERLLANEHTKRAYLGHRHGPPTPEREPTR